MSCYNLASYPGSLIIAGEEKRAWFQSLTHAPIAPEFWGEAVIFRLMCDVSSRFISGYLLIKLQFFLQILVDTAIICVANNNDEYVYTSQSHNCNVM